MDFLFGLPPDSNGNTGIVVFVDRLSKMAHLAAVPGSVDAAGTAQLSLIGSSVNTACLRLLSRIVIPGSREVLAVHLQGAGDTVGHVHSGLSAN